MNLVIVESPTKSRTIGKFLGPDFKVLSSYGHVRDLPKDELGVDVEKDFKPKYIIIPKAKKTIQSLKKEVKEAKTVILATDEDREGEAIAFHLTNALELEKPQRIVFHEITKSAIAKALENPREININLVDAQQTRRILDRIVGYKLSPFLWKKVARRLSAGRVQSVAVRLVAEREKEIKDFVPKEYWSITAFLRQEKGGEFEARLTKENGKVILKLGINNQKEADKIIKNLEKAEYKIVNVEKKEIKRNPLPPFMTSTLQQEAWKKLRFPARFTMSVAQNLYERGLITYHRTDSLNIANQALLDAKKFISDNYGAKHWAGFLRKYKAKGRAQEAHEAIRPAYSESAPDTLKSKVKLDDNQYRLYDLIWRRFIASQMAQAVFDSTIIDIEAKQYTFRANGQIMKFDGFLKIYPLKYEETQLPNLKTDEILKLQKLTPLQHFTQPSPRFTEATLIKALEENGIGRPSTYATIISTIQLRNYIEKNEEKRFKPTEIGQVVNDLLVKHFPKIVDIKFTAEMEEDLDKIAEGQKKWIPIIREFYDPFAKNLERKYEEVSKKDITEKETKKTCPKCKAPLLMRLGKFGRFYACSKFPKCKYTESLPENILGIKCPKCKKGQIVEKRTRKNKLFYGCNQYPDCDRALWDKPTGKTCPKCKALLVEKRKGLQCSNKECDYKE